MTKKLRVEKEKKIPICVSITPSMKKKILKKYATIADFIILTFEKEFQETSDKK